MKKIKLEWFAKTNILFSIAFIAQILLFLGVLSFILNIIEVQNQYVKQISDFTLSFFSSRIIVFIAAPFTIFCFISTVIYTFFLILMKKKFFSTKKGVISLIAFFIILIVNVCCYTVASLVYFNYSWFA